MKKLTNKNLFFLSLGIIILCEAVSFMGIAWPAVVNVFTALLIMGVLWLSLKQPAYGFLILLAELLIGSQGYLLWIGETGNHISLRIALWIVVMAIWVVKELTQFLRVKRLANHWSNFSFYFPFLFLLLILALAAVNGFLSNNDNNLIFIEAKRWLYIITLVPLIIVLKQADFRQEFSTVISAAALWLALKTLILLYIFSHGLEISDVIYTWTRANLLGEITTLANGFSRVFLQSQVFSLLGFIFATVIFLKLLKQTAWQLSKQAVVYGLASALFLSVIIISLSRSFWFGLSVAIIFMIVVIIFFLRPKIKELTKGVLFLLAILVATLCILFITLEFPLPKPLFGFNSSLLSDRANTNDAAANSRWALLPVMNQAIFKQPILGYGLGKTLTYNSSDPRIIKSSSNGSYTTNAFEWGWLDIWLKLGILGLVAYLWFLLAIAKQAALAFKNNPYQSLAAMAALLALVCLNVFTPYLNHPLGFAYLAIIMITLSFEERGLA